MKTVTIKAPIDCIFNPANPAKLSKLTGTAVASSSEAIMGSSPDLPHKLAHVSSDFEGSSGQDQLSEFSMPFTDPGSSNAMRPDSASMDLEKEWLN